MKIIYLALTIIVFSSLKFSVAYAQTCENENSTYTLGMVTYFLNDPRFEPDRIGSGIQNLNISDVTMLQNFQHSELCGQLRQTQQYLNAPDGVNDISFFKSSGRRFIVYFFLDTLPTDDGLTFYSGPIGIVDILDENLEHILSVSIR